MSNAAWPPKSQRVETESEKAKALQVALENLELPVCIAARRVDLGVNKAVRLYVGIVAQERERYYDRGWTDARRIA